MAKTLPCVCQRACHPRYKKVITGYKKFYAHDEKGEAKVGDSRLASKKTRPCQKQTLAYRRSRPEKERRRH